MIRTMQNTQWKWCYGSLFLAALSSIVCIYAFTYIDGFSGGYAIAFVSFFLAVSAIAVAALFFHRARVMDSSEQHTAPRPLEYSPEVAMQSARRDMQIIRTKSCNVSRNCRDACFLRNEMMIFAGEVAFYRYISSGGHGFSFLYQVAPKIALRYALSSPREAYIAENGIIYEGVVYPFQSFLMGMNGVKFEDRSEKKPAVLIFSFIQSVGLSIRSPFDIEIPVPQGEEEMARKIVQTYFL